MGLAQAGQLATAGGQRGISGQWLLTNNRCPETTTVTDDSIALRELLKKSADADLLREMIGFAAEMGDVVEPRRELIQDNALKVVNLDV